MAKKSKSLFDRVDVETPQKTVSARIPQNLFDDFEEIVSRAKQHNLVLSITKVITQAISDAVISGKVELDKLDAELEKKA